MKIRDVIGSPLSAELVALLLLPEVEFVPILEQHRDKAPALPSALSGYAGILASLPPPPVSTPIAKASTEEVQRMLVLLDAVRGGKGDENRRELTRMILRLLADVQPDAAASEAQKRGL